MRNTQKVFGAYLEDVPKDENLLPLPISDVLKIFSLYGQLIYHN